MIKTYKTTRFSHLERFIKVQNKSIRIVFSGGYVGADINIPSTFITNNPALQNAIEKDERYGIDFVLLSSHKEPIDDRIAELRKVSSEEIKEVKLAQYTNVKTLKQAIGVLVEEYQVNASLITSKEVAKNIAKGLGVEFPNL